QAVNSTRDKLAYLAPTTVVFRRDGTSCCNARFQRVIGCSATKITSFGRSSSRVASKRLTAFLAFRCHAVISPISDGLGEPRSRYICEGSPVSVGAPP